MEYLNNERKVYSDSFKQMVVSEVNSGSTFHQAIDYTVIDKDDKKYTLQAVNGGLITSIPRGDSGNYKIVKAGGYGYGQIFTNDDVDFKDLESLF
ncbi:MAG: hypothetical protein WAT79_09000 [Saprospiraceae bacterium]